MSNRRLEAATIPDHVGPIFDGMEEFQNLFHEDKFKHFPIKAEFIEHYAAEFRSLMFLRVKFYPEFKTEDGTIWMGVRIALSSVDWRVLFPKGRDRHHEDGTVSSHHIALYYDAPEEVDPKYLKQVIQALFAVLMMAKRDFRH